MKVCTIILHFNSIDDTLRALKSVKDNACSIDDVVLVNNSCDENLEEIAGKELGNVSVFNPGRNLGFAGGNNYAVKCLEGRNIDFFFFLNNDAFIEGREFDRLVDFATGKNCIVSPAIFSETNERIESAGISVNSLTGRIKHMGFGKERAFLSSRPYCCDALCGTAMLVSKEVFKKVGGFNEEFFLYMEDVEFCIKAALSGTDCYVFPGVKVIHKGRASTSDIDNSLALYYSLRNHLQLLGNIRPLPCIFRQIRTGLVFCYYFLYSVKSERRLFSESVFKCFKALKSYKEKRFGEYC